MAEYLTQLAARVGALLTRKGWTLATAESCTGGLISHQLTNVQGSSCYFIGGIVAYANRVKEELLGVPNELLQAHGAVSAEAALAMAQGVRRILATDIGLAVTGIAGPSGGTTEKPVGTVFIAIVTPQSSEVHHFVSAADREGNKRFSAETALRLLETTLRASRSGRDSGSPTSDLNQPGEACRVTDGHLS